MDIATYILSRKYTQESLTGAGALKGKDGASAYEVAVENGFTGTETQWLASIKGQTGDVTIEQDASELLWSGTASANSTITLNKSLYRYGMLCFIINSVQCYCLVPSKTTQELHAFGGKSLIYNNSNTFSIASADFTTTDGLNLTPSNIFFTRLISSTVFSGSITAVYGVANTAIIL